MIVNGQTYKITNIITGESYVGATGISPGKTYIDRFEEHIKYAKKGIESPLYDAIREYGKENFRTELLEEGITSKTELGEREKHYIKIHNTYIYSKDAWGYNQTIGGAGTIGYIFTEEDIEKMRESQKNVWLDPERRKKAEDTNNKPVVIFKNGEEIGMFSSILDATRTLEQIIGEGIGMGIYKMINDGWRPKWGLLKCYRAMLLSDYEKLQEDPEKLSEYLLEITRIEEEERKRESYKSANNSVRKDYIIVEDLKNEIVHKFNIQKEAKDFIGCSQATISLRLKDGKIYQQRYKIYYEDQLEIS